MSLEADLRALLEQGIRERVYEQASVAVYRSGQVVANVGTHDPDAVFDVASVTKVATAVLALSGPPPSSDVLDLLAHCSGLPAWRPFFALAAGALKTSLPEIIEDANLQAQTRAITQRFVESVVPRDAAKPTYSDLGFLKLGWLLESDAGSTLPELAEHRLASLQLASWRWGGENAEAVRTGRVRPRLGNPTDVPELSSQQSDDHAVDDDNAAAMGGICGHAGLWSNARDLAKLGDAIRRCAEGESDVPLPPERARLMFERACGSRTYGLDTPSGENPAIGSILGKGPKGAAGHLGFTGCSLWMDRDAELSIAFLSNAVIIERPNPRIRAFRPRVHDLIARGLGT